MEGYLLVHPLSCCFALLLQAHCGQLCHTSAMVLKMPPVRSRKKFSSEFFIPFLKQNTLILSCWDHLCSINMRTHHVEKDTDDPFCCTKAVSKAFSCSKTLPLSWKNPLHVLWESWEASHQSLQKGSVESRNMFQVFWGDTLKEVCCLMVR